MTSIRLDETNNTIKVADKKIDIKVVNRIENIKVHQTGLPGPKGDPGESEWGQLTGDINDQTDLKNALDSKVDKEAGKGLSTNDYSDAEKSKLSGIEASADVTDAANVAAAGAVMKGNIETISSARIPLWNGTQWLATGFPVAGSNVVNSIPHRDGNGHIFITTQSNAASSAATNIAYVTARDNEVRSEAISRGTNLITNGTAYMGDNTNFTAFTLEKGDQPPGTSGTYFLASGTAQISAQLNEAIPVDLNARYEAAVWARQVNAGVTSRFYFAIEPVDIDGLSIPPSSYMEQANTRTTLAADLKPGDTTISLTSAANWNNAAGSNSHFRSIIFWNYVDGTGKLWPVGEYSRNYTLNIYDDGAISGNTITLRAPWAGGTYAAGTVVGNASSAANYMYPMNNVLVNDTWTRHKGTFLVGGAAHTNNLVAATDRFPLPTTSARIRLLINYGVSGGTSKQRFAGISFSEVSPKVTKVVSAPTATSSPGFPGDMYWDANYLYVYTGSAWRRVGLSTW